MVPVSKYYLFPHLLPKLEQGSWTYKCRESWKITLSQTVICNKSLCFHGVLQQALECVMRDPTLELKDASLYSNALHMRVRSVNKLFEKMKKARQSALVELVGQSSNTVFEKMKKAGQNSMIELSGQGSLVELFVARIEPHQCCISGTNFPKGSSKLIVCAKGRSSRLARDIWNGGFRHVLAHVVETLTPSEVMAREVTCPECLGCGKVTEAACWSHDRVMDDTAGSTLLCQKGHYVDRLLLTGEVDQEEERCFRSSAMDNLNPYAMPTNKLVQGVVLVGLWDGHSKCIKSVGSGFVLDNKLGLVVTASHTVVDMEPGISFGEEYFGLKSARIVLGVISNPTAGPRAAVFRYFAQIVSSDVSRVDACILRITTKLESDVRHEDQLPEIPEILLKNNAKRLKKERLVQLKVAEEDCDLHENVRLLGYNQGGEGLLTPGSYVDHHLDLVQGYVCKWFRCDHRLAPDATSSFVPREEIVVKCHTIRGHSGAPVVNRKGEVIGILSRADNDNQRCYLVPAREWKGLVASARTRCRSVSTNRSLLNKMCL